MARPISKEDINAVFQRADGTLWRLIAVVEQPTATFESAAATGSDRRGRAVHQHVTAPVGSGLADEFTRLVPEAS